MLAKYLGVPDKIIDKNPSAGLWQGQTDGSKFGFTYKETDQVLYSYYENIPVKEIINKGYINAHKIILWSKNNRFKHIAPYKLYKDYNYK